jgi:hypothetical protein
MKKRSADGVGGCLFGEFERVKMKRKIVFLDKFIYFPYIFMSQILLSIILQSFGKETVSVLIINKFG